MMQSFSSGVACGSSVVATVGWDPHAATTRVPLKMQSVESGVGARGK
jgi:hypothetical protein